MADVIVLDNPNAGITYTRQKVKRARLRLFLGSRQWQITIISLILLDALLVATDIILVNIYCGHECVPNAVHVAEDALRWGSIVILSFFVLEWLFEAWVQGVRRWTRSWLHRVDLLIIVTSLGLEVLSLGLQERAIEIGGLLVAFRLWRVVRVLHAIGDVQHHYSEDRTASLEAQVRELEHTERAHHVLIQELHREYIKRMRAMRRQTGDGHAEKPEEMAMPTSEQVIESVADRNKDVVHLHRQSLRRVSALPQSGVGFNGHL